MKIADTRRINQERIGIVPVGVTIAVVIAQQIVLLADSVVGNLQRLIDGREEALGQVRDQVDKTSQVVLNVCRRQAAHEVKRAVKLLLGAVRHDASIKALERGNIKRLGAAGAKGTETIQNNGEGSDKGARAAAHHDKTLAHTELDCPYRTSLSA